MATSVRAPACRLDLLSLELEESEHRLDVRCKACDAEIIFIPDDVDYLANSFYKCTQRYHCRQIWPIYQTRAMLDDAISEDFYVNWPLPEEQLYRMILEEHHGPTAYHYTRPANMTEIRQEAYRRLGKRREEVRKLFEGK